MWHNPVADQSKHKSAKPKAHGKHLAGNGAVKHILKKSNIDILYQATAGNAGKSIKLFLSLPTS